MGAYQEKLQHVNQERTQMKVSSQSKPFSDAEPLRVPIVEAHPEKLQTVHPEKKQLKYSTKQKFSSYANKREISKNENWENKSGYTRTAAPCDPRSVENTQK